MKLSYASSYALHAVAHMAAQGKSRPVASQHIARAQGIPELFLAKVLKPLVAARVVHSLRGPNGGYRLAKPAHKISVLEVVEAVDGPIRGAVSFTAEGHNSLDARLEAICTQTAEQVRRHLGKVHISDLTGRR